MQHWLQRMHVDGYEGIAVDCAWEDVRSKWINAELTINNTEFEL